MRAIWVGLATALASTTLAAPLALAEPVELSGPALSLDYLQSGDLGAFEVNSLYCGFIDDGVQFFVTRGVVEFYLPALPADASLSRIELGLYQVWARGTPLSLSVYGFDGNVAITGRENFEQTLLATGVAPAADGTLALDVTPFVSDLLDRGVSWAGFMVRGDHEASYLQDGVAVTTGYRGFSDYAHDPEIAPVLRFLPEPSAAACVLILFVGLAARR
ncbi:MAG: hypothetical protein ACHQ6T_06805 [Myxococcota bacterium]